MGPIRWKGALAALVVGLALATPAKAQLVNGNFDQTLDSLPGWTAFGVNPSPFGSLSSPQNATFNATDDRLSQIVNVASAGQYVLSFFLKSVLNPDGGPGASQFAVLQALVNGAVAVVGAGNTFGYTQTTSFAFNLNAGDNLIEFTNAQFFNGAELLRLDNVTLTAVPGPLVGSGLASFAFAGFGIMAYRSRRRRSLHSA